jgi:hypothetical protein
VADYPQIVRGPLDLSRLTCLKAQYQSDRYERYQSHLLISADATPLEFACTTLVGGAAGARQPFPYPRYGLMVQSLREDGTWTDPVERGSYTVAGTATDATVTLTLGDEPDGPALLRLQPYDANGAPVPNSSHCPPFLVTIDRRCKADLHPYEFKQFGSFEWFHVAPEWQYVVIPRSLRLTEPRSFPLQKRQGQDFNTALTPEDLVRVNLAIPDETTMLTPRRMGFRTLRPDPERPGVEREIWVDADVQGYYQQDWFRDYSRIKVLDGARGVCTAQQINTLWIGHATAVYNVTPHSMRITNGDGYTRTLYGLRHKRPGYWAQRKADWWNDSNVEVVGDWFDENGNPLERRYCFLWECWGICFDWRTTVHDEHTTIGLWHPHEVGKPIVNYACDRHGWVLRAEFDGRDPARVQGMQAPWKPVRVQRWIKANDPWTVKMVGNVLYVWERGLHRISKWNADTREYLGDEAANPQAATLGKIDDSQRRWAGAGVTACRAQWMVAPEGGDVLDGYIYMGSFATQQVIRWKLGQYPATREVVCEPNCTGKSRYVYVTVLDGTAGPRGYVMTSTWAEANFGRSQIFVANPGVSATSGRTLTHRREWIWQRLGYGTASGGATSSGLGGRTITMGYTMAGDARNGRIANTSSENGIACWFKRQPQDPAPVDDARARIGRQYFNRYWALLFNDFGYQTEYDLPLPWGVNADMDLFLEANGHIKPGTTPYKWPLAPDIKNVRFDLDGAQVTVSADVAGATSVKVNGQVVTLPHTMPIPADRKVTIAAFGAGGRAEMPFLIDEPAEEDPKVIAELEAEVQKLTQDLATAQQQAATEKARADSCVLQVQTLTQERDAAQAEVTSVTHARDALEQQLNTVVERCETLTTRAAESSILAQQIVTKLQPAGG